MNREALDRWCERGILCLVLLILLFTPLAFGGKPQSATGFFLDFLAVNPFLVAQVSTMLILILWSLRLWLSPRPKILWPPICWAVAVFVFYAIVRYLTADLEYIARQELVHVLVYAVVFFAILNNLHRQETIQIISCSLVFLAVAISSWAIYQFVTDSTRIWHKFTPYAHRGSGTYVNPNHLGGFLEMLVPMALALTVVSRLKPLAKVFMGYAVLVMVGGIAVTVSRGAWLSTALSLALFFGILFFHDKFRLPSFIFIFAVLMGAGFFIPKTYVFQYRMRQLFSHGKIDNDARFALWQPALKLWQDNPLWGAGPGHYDYRFRMYRPETLQLQPERAHNDYINTLTDWGLVGTIIVASAFVMLFFSILKMWRFVRGTPSDLDQKNSNKFAYVLGSSVGLAAALFHSCVDFNMNIPGNALVAVALMAVLTTHLRFATESYWVTLGSWSRAIASSIALAVVLYLGWHTCRIESEKAWLSRADIARLPSRYSPAEAAFLEQAFSIEPNNFETASAIGEAYLVQSREGGENYQELAAKAMLWFERAMKLNPWDGYNYLHYGWCLDWVNRSTESWPYFAQAEQLDPSGYFTIANIGRHYVEIRDFAAAKPWLERSVRLQWDKNELAHSYLELVNRKLLENATNDISAKLGSSAP